MKIAIVGAGISGNVVAYHLRDAHEITVYEAGHYVGGHTNTVDVDDAAGPIAIDTGFIVFNDRTYPHFRSLLADLGQASRKSVMSFSVRSEKSGLEYCGSTLGGLFAQRRNLVRPRFLRMIRDILRFNRQAVIDIHGRAAGTTVAEYLASENYSADFADNYLVPMSAAIWSAEPGQVLDMPLHFLVRFFHNHGLLQIKDRPTWYTIEGGSREYVNKLVRGHRDRIRLSTPVESISRLGDGVQVRASGCEPQRFDYVFIAAHADQALKMLADPTQAERDVLGAIPYQSNEAILHCDEKLMPRRRQAWAAWNYHVPKDAGGAMSVTYNMNILQGIRAKHQYCVTLNAGERIDESRIHYATTYAHPVFTAESVTAQQRHEEVNSGNRTAFCGAYWRNGFHEDGVYSALEALRHFEQEQRREELSVRRAS